MILNVLGHILHILLIPQRQNHRLDAGPVGRNNFSLTPPTGSISPLRVISPVMARRAEPFGPRSGNKGHQHGDPGRGSVFGNGPGRHMHMDIMGIKKRIIHPQSVRMGPDKA